MRIASNCFASLRVYKYRAKWVAFQKGLDTVGVRGSTIGVRAPIKYLRTRGYGRDEYGTIMGQAWCRDILLASYSHRGTKYSLGQGRSNQLEIVECIPGVSESGLGGIRHRSPKSAF